VLCRVVRCAAGCGYVCRQLKSFWYSFPAVTMALGNDLDFHKFEKLELTPSVPYDPNEAKEEKHKPLDPAVRRLIDEMRLHKSSFERTRDTQKDNELLDFWLRKSKQPYELTDD
jgi:hypothetical protein